MDIVPNPVIEHEVLKNMRAKYTGGKDRAEGIHMTQCIYCLRKSYYDLTDPLPVTDETLMLFALGFGLEKILLSEQSIMKPGCKDGIHYSPDFVSLTATKAELKTTRASTTRPLPDTWVEQIKGYCYAEGDTTYDLVVLHILGNYKPPFPQIKGYRIFFSEFELADNWDNICTRRDRLVEGLEEGEPPPAKVYAKDWECKYCSYKLRCGVMK